MVDVFFVEEDRREVGGNVLVGTDPHFGCKRSLGSKLAGGLSQSGMALIPDWPPGGRLKGTVKLPRRMKRSSGECKLVAVAGGVVEFLAWLKSPEADYMRARRVRS